MPKGFEKYKDRPINYSFGNFIFGYNLKEWENSLISTIMIDKDRIFEIKYYPILCKEEIVFSPKLLKNKEGLKFVYRIKKESKKYCKTNLLLNKKYSLSFKKLAGSK